MSQLPVINLKGRYEYGKIKLSWRLPSGDTMPAIYIAPLKSDAYFNEESIDIKRVIEKKTADAKSGTTLTLSNENVISKKRIYVFLGDLGLKEELGDILNSITNESGFYVDIINGETDVGFCVKKKKVNNDISKYEILTESGENIENDIIGYEVDGIRYSFGRDIIYGVTKYPALYALSKSDISVVVNYTGTGINIYPKKLSSNRFLRATNKILSKIFSRRR